MKANCHTSYKLGDWVVTTPAHALASASVTGMVMGIITQIKGPVVSFTDNAGKVHHLKYTGLSVFCYRDDAEQYLCEISNKYIRICGEIKALLLEEMS